jgi:hypothetical protein
MSESSREPLQYPAIVQHPPVGIHCRKKRLIEGNAKCHHLKKFTADSANFSIILIEEYYFESA